MTKFVSGEIRITKTPDGEAPEWVRREWVGKTLPVSAIDDAGFLGALSHKTKADYLRYVVSQDEAIRILGVGSPTAAQWWQEHGFPKPGMNFGFNAAQAEAVGTLKEVSPKIRPFFGLLEEGVGAHDAGVNQPD